MPARSSAATNRKAGSGRSVAKKTVRRAARGAPPTVGAPSEANEARATSASAATAAQPAAAGFPFEQLPWFKWWTDMMGAATGGSSLPQVEVDPSRVLQIQSDYVQHMARLWTDFVEHPDKAGQPIKDNRFAGQAWTENPLASFYARAYLTNADFLNRLADSVEADRKTKRRIKFAVSQWVDAASPSNYLALNPQAQKILLETGGESLKAGLDNLLGDLKKGKISQSDESAFEVGRNIATSEGVVVYENDLFQLIQYKPLTPRVRARPFLFVPPSINKFYILDLQPENSMVRYAVERGNTVFLMSWKNPHQPEARLTWDDYVERGPIEAIHVVQEITGTGRINVLGFCVGGTILATALAVMYARGEDPAASFTLMTSLLDFEDAGVLEIFIDERHVRMRERQLSKGGLMPGRELANTFSSLRPNDLVWNYVVSNYLEGKQPPAFDLLYWNGDSTNLPGPMYTWYLRNMYLENNLRTPNKLTCCGVPIDLTRIRVPTYAFAAMEDHIVPWKAGYASARLIPGDKAHGVKFVLGASGHIAGSINPPSKNRRSFWVAPPGPLPANSEAWLHNATERPGSWWTDWDTWLAQFAGGEKPAPKSYGSAKYKPIEPAPGRYVKEKA